MTGQFTVVETDEEKGTAVISLEGDLDYSIYTGFKRAIHDLVEKGMVNITYDVSKMTAIPSLGLGIIMWSHVELQNRGGKITILGANDQIKRVFTATQLDTLVTVL